MATETEAPAAAPCLLLGPPLIRAARPSPAAGAAAGDDTDASHPFLDLLDVAFNAPSAAEMKAALTPRRALRNSGYNVFCIHDGFCIFVSCMLPSF
ncbi:hypothetical protein D1007_03220 [Hordeum vulgare]|nr:hypothetical protein D1007_03220 [Hordeum vulgare]